MLDTRGGSCKGCINKNSCSVSVICVMCSVFCVLSVYLNINPTSRESCQGGGGGGDDEKEVVGHRDQEDVQAGI